MITASCGPPPTPAQAHRHDSKTTDAPLVEKFRITFPFASTPAVWQSTDASSFAD
jgi:hypothetical protein